MLIIPYDTESKSRNVLVSPLGEEGHEVAKGWTRVRMIMTLEVDVTAERRHYNTHRPLKGKRLTTFCASLTLLQNVFAVHRRAIPQPSARRAVKLKNPPAVGRSILRTFFHNPSTQPAASAAPPFFVANAVSQSPECSSCHMTQKDKSRNADFILIALRAIPQPSARRAVKLKNPPAVRPVNPKNLFPQPFEPSEPGPLRGPNKKIINVYSIFLLNVIQ